MINSVAFPFIIVLIVTKLYHRLEEEDIKDRIGELYEGLRVKSKWALMYQSTFIGRRLIFAVIIVSLKKNPSL